MTVVDRHIVNGNEPLVEDCPLNKCYSLIGGDVPKCVAKESCYQIDCHDGGVDIRFSKHLIYGDPRYFFEQDAPLSRLFFTQVEDGWTNDPCKNGNMTLEGDEFVFTAGIDNECYLLKRESKSSSAIESVYTFASNNVLFSKGIQVGKQMKYSFHCPLPSYHDDTRALYEDKTDKTVKPMQWYENTTILSLLALLLLATGKRLFLNSGNQTITSAGNIAARRSHTKEINRVTGKGL